MKNARSQTKKLIVMLLLLPAAQRRAHAPLNLAAGPYTDQIPCLAINISRNAGKLCHSSAPCQGRPQQNSLASQH